MKRQDFEKEKELRKIAIKAFPEFFKSDYSLDEEKTLEDLRERIEDFGYPRPVILISVYNYLEEEIVNSNKLSKLNAESVRELYKSFKKLIDAISNYGFNARYDNTYGATQNQNNENILFELVSLINNIIDALYKIDLYLEKLSILKEDLLINNMNKEINKLIRELDDACTSLARSEKYYHDMWNVVFQGGDYSGYGSLNDLGVAKAEWRKDRNKACRTYIKTYESLIALGNYAYRERNGIGICEWHPSIIDDNIEHIKRGPNYYCYLTQDEITAEVDKNRAKKRERKNKQ